MRFHLIHRSLTVLVLGFSAIVGRAHAQSDVGPTAPPPSAVVQSSSLRCTTLTQVNGVPTSAADPAYLCHPAAPGAVPELSGPRVAEPQTEPRSSNAPLAIGASVGAVIGLVFGGVIVSTVQDDEGNSGELDDLNDSLDVACGALAGAGIGAILGFSVGLVVKASATEDAAPTARAAAKPSVTPVVAVTSTGAFAGLSGAF